MSKTYYQKQFDNELAEILREAKARGKSSKRIRARDLHKRVVSSGDVRMRMACRALQKLLSRQGSKALTYEVEFDTGKLPG